MALTSDPNLILLNHKLDEEAVGEEDQSISVRSETGFFYGELAPSGSHRRVLAFSGLSNVEPLVVGVSDESIIRLLARFYSGSVMTVYRNFPPLLDTDESDLVAVEGNSVQSLSWGDPVMTRLEFAFEGVEVVD